MPVLPDAYFTDAIKKHALADKPNEACGLIFQESGTYVARPYPNDWIAPSDHPEQTKEHFILIDHRHLLLAMKTNSLVSTYHSHTHEDETPSDVDKANADALKLPLFVYSTKTDRFSTYQPQNKELPLVGRPYVPLIHDCFGLCATYLTKELDIEIPYLEHTVDESLKGKQKGTVEYMTANGWKAVKTIRPYDVIVMIVKGHNFPNHLGVIMKDGKTLLHHLYRRFSQTDPYGGYWEKVTTLVLRHPHFLTKKANG